MFIELEPHADEPNLVKRTRNAMKSIFLVCLCATMVGCAESDRVDNRNFAIDTYNPTPNEIQLAEQRLETSKVFPSEVQLLWPKLINSETTASFFSKSAEASVTCSSDAF